MLQSTATSGEIPAVVQQLNGDAVLPKGSAPLVLQGLCTCAADERILNKVKIKIKARYPDFI